MPPVEAFLWTFAGVFISFILPPLLRAAGVGRKHDPTASIQAFMPRIRAIITNRYTAVTAASLILAFLVLAMQKGTADTWHVAVLNGLGWQSMLARVFSPGT